MYIHAYIRAHTTTKGTRVQTHILAKISSGNTHGKQREATGSQGQPQEATRRRSTAIKRYLTLSNAILQTNSSGTQQRRGSRIASGENGTTTTTARRPDLETIATPLPPPISESKISISW